MGSESEFYRFFIAFGLPNEPPFWGPGGPDMEQHGAPGGDPLGAKVSPKSQKVPTGLIRSSKSEPEGAKRVQKVIQKYALDMKQ